MKKNPQMPYRITPAVTEGILKDRVLTGPSYAVLHINTDCNLRCEYCWSHSPLLEKKPGKSVFMDLATVQRIVGELNSLGVRYINLSSSGEPWLHPRIAGIIRCVKETGIYLAVNTNLTFAGRNLRDAFALCDRLRVNFSATGTPKNRVRLLKNLEYYTSLYKKHGRPSIELVYILTKNNYRFVGKFLDLAERLQGSRVSFRVPIVRDRTRPLLMSPRETACLNRLTHRKKPYRVPSNLKDVIRAYGKTGRKTAAFKRCFMGWIGLSISTPGQVSFCCNNEKLAFGNIYHDSLGAIWNGSKAHLVRLCLKHRLDRRQGLWAGCDNCDNEVINRRLDRYYERNQ